MNSRERIAATLEGRQPDRVPLDFGATPTSGIAASLVYRIKRHVGQLEPDERIRITDPYQMLGEIDARLREFLGIDTVALPAPSNMFGFRNEDFKPWTTFDGTPVWVPGLFNTEPDASGSIPQFAGGDRSFPPSAVMPKGSHYFDSTHRQKPIDEDKLDPRDNTEEFAPLCESDLAYYRDGTERLWQETSQAIAISVPGTAFGDIALVPAPFLKNPKGIRGIAEWYMALAANPDYVRAVFAAQCEIALVNLQEVWKVVGERAQIIFMSGTDFGSQQGLICSPKAWRDLFFPFQKRLNDWVHANTSWKIFIHSCGAVSGLIDGLIEAGFDILNPVQCSAVGMDPASLKSRFGDRITFWGGSVDTQKTMPRGTPAEVAAEVSERIQTFKPGGHYVFNAIHNLQADVPIENFVAMFETYRREAQY